MTLPPSRESDEESPPSPLSLNTDMAPRLKFLSNERALRGVLTRVVPSVKTAKRQPMQRTVNLRALQSGGVSRYWSSGAPDILDAGRDEMA